MTLHRPWRQAFSESTLPFRPSIALSIRLGLPRTRSSSVKSCEFFWVFFFFWFPGNLGKILVFWVLTKENVIWMLFVKTPSGFWFVG